MVQQQLELRSQFRRQRQSIVLHQHREMDIKVCRVAVVVARLLEIDAVALHVSGKLRHENLEPQLAPALRVFELRQQQSDVKKPERLAGQVRVWTEVCRQKRLEMQRVQVQEFQNARYKINRQ